MKTAIDPRVSTNRGFDGDMLRNVCLVNQESPAITRCADQSITDSYCIYTHRSGEGFSVEGVLTDAWVVGHLHPPGP
jgi:hypothetical protein